jgi:rhodanese-related sulfurtransferase
MQHLSPRELASWLADKARPTPLLVDVREGWEVNRGRIEGARHIPMASIPEACGELPKDQPIVIYCQHGVRSMRVAAFLLEQGCQQVFNLSGGINAWSFEVGAVVTD